MTKVSAILVQAAMQEQSSAPVSPATGEIRVTVADPKKLNLDGLTALLGMKGIRVVGSTSDLTDLVSLVRDSRPDVVIVDAAMASQVGDQQWVRLQKSFPGLKTLLVADVETAARYAVLAPPETRGMIQRSQDSDELMLAIRTIASGRMWEMPIKKPLKSARGRKMSPLSPRERDIAVLITQGYGNREISQRLGLSEQSVKNLVSRILSKQGLKNRTQIALWRLASGGEEGA